MANQQSQSCCEEDVISELPAEKATRLHTHNVRTSLLIAINSNND